MGRNFLDYDLSPAHRDDLCCGVERDWRIGYRLKANRVVNNKSLRGTEEDL